MATSDTTRLKSRDRGGMDARQQSEQFRGWLLKWTNYIKGYQKRWFVLANGLLSYYRTQEEMAHTCRGTINLAGACIDTIDATHFVITNGPSQVFHLRGLNEVERQRWVTALELAKAKAIKNLEEVSDDDDDEAKLDEKPLLVLSDKLTELSTTHNLVMQKHHEILRTLSEIETSKDESGIGGANLTKLKEKTAMFKITANAMAKVSEEYLLIATNVEKRWQRLIQHERSMRMELQENFEALAKQMHRLEANVRRASQKGLDVLEKELEDSRQFSSSNVESPNTSPTRETTTPIKKLPGGAQRVHGDKKEVTFNLSKSEGSTPPKSPPSSPVVTDTETSQFELFYEEDEDEDEKFFDASDIPESLLTPASAHSLSHKRTASSVSVNEATPIPIIALAENLPTTSPDRKCMQTFLKPGPALLHENVLPTLDYRRTTIPPRPNAKINLWSIMKNCIGKELTKIPMPVHFGEPLSFLQRMSEDLTYSDILDRAAACDNTLEEVAHVAAFIASSYRSTFIRVNKPFNPMLGETFECDRRAELGWRVLLEQVSHHPPMLAMHAEHKDWTLWQEYTLASKFRGKYIQCFPVGCVHLVFHRSGSHYTWNKVITVIHNIIVGKVWVDNYGDMTIVNHTTNEKCEVKYHPYSYFTRERQKKITGRCLDCEGVPKISINGYWDEYVECAPILSYEGRNPVTGPSKELWRYLPLTPGAESMYNFSEFSCSLNEMEDNIAPTDSRFRPDQRTMENGDFDEANRVKALLEEKQRTRRRKREALQAQAAEAASNGNTEEAARLEKEALYEPVWFQKEYDPFSNNMMYVYKGGYWECKETSGWVKLNLTNIFET